MNKAGGNYFEKFLLILRGLLFIVIGFYIAYPAAQILYNVDNAVSWPQAAGRVVSSAVESRWLSRDSARGQEYSARILYAYSVKGQDYISDDFRLYDVWGKSRAAVEKVLAEYPAGREVAVYYKPSDPRIAALDITAVPVMECLRFGFGALLLLTGAGTILATFIRMLFR